jgi:beta-lactamase regulating signal transducer with metallopeptidase domain
MNDVLSLTILGDTRAFALGVASCGACICALVLVLARRLGRRSEPASYGILLAGVAGLLAMPALVGVGQSLPARVFWPFTEAEEEIVKVSAERLREFVIPAAEETAHVEEESSWNPVPVIGTALVAAWCLGLIIGLGRLLCAWRKQRRVLIGQPWRAAFWTEELKARLARKLGLAKFPAVYVSPAAPMPMVLGIWRPVIILPDATAPSWTPSQWQAVLLHEAAHIARRDSWAVLAQRLAVILFWWCPLAHRLSRRLNDLRESICDNYALQAPCDAVAYAELLVESAERLVSLRPLPLPVALLDSARGGLEARVTRLLEKERRPMTKLSLPGKILGAGFLVAACLLTTAATALSGGQVQPEKKIHIVLDNKEVELGDVQFDFVIDAVDKKPVNVRTDVKPVVTGDKDKVIRLWATDSGKAVGQLAIDGVRFTTQDTGAQTNPDPRIEELVKQAEAIKPGSGAQIRKALQGATKQEARSARVVLRDLTVSPEIKAIYGVATDKSAPGIVRFLEAGTGKKIIILSIEDGTVKQLQEKDLKKILEKGIRSGAGQKGETSSDKAAPRIELQLKELELKQAARNRALEAKTEAMRTNELDALRRQLERISAELQSLKQRLDAPKR